MLDLIDAVSLMDLLNIPVDLNLIVQVGVVSHDYLLP